MKTRHGKPIPMKWAYGVTTIPERIDLLLPRTLNSLAAAGFDNPHLYVDGCRDSALYASRGFANYTLRGTRVRTAGAWLLALAEVYLRDAFADRYAIFQDDMIAYRNLRAYLERCTYTPKTYWNLYTFPKNAEWTGGKAGWCSSNQRGWGAVALVFDRDTAWEILSSRYIWQRPQDPTKGHQNIDGGIITGLSNVGWMEMVHNPSLVWHTGIVSSATSNKIHPQAESFRGEDFDALELLS